MDDCYSRPQEEKVGGNRYAKNEKQTCAYEAYQSHRQW